MLIVVNKNCKKRKEFMNHGCYFNREINNGKVTEVLSC